MALRDVHKMRGQRLVKEVTVHRIPDQGLWDGPYHENPRHLWWNRW